MKVKTLKAFSGPDGRHAKGIIIDVPSTRADWLTENGFAERVDKPVQERPKRAAPKHSAVAKKAAPKADPAQTTK